MKTLYALVASPFAAHFPDLYEELGITAERFDSARNLHRALKKQKPDFFVGEFIYAWGNDYAGNTISNLDVTLRTLQAVAPGARIVIVMQPGEAAHIGKLLELFPVHAMLKYPIAEDQMRAALQSPVH
ncbi:MAG: hypothetical protein FJ209_00825 [Betaproteobacteria bacterium]|nr:hypothetical protein [Betaproteobacteria bacterium]